MDWFTAVNGLDRAAAFIEFVHGRLYTFLQQVLQRICRSCDDCVDLFLLSSGKIAQHVTYDFLFQCPFRLSRIRSADADLDAFKIACTDLSDNGLDALMPTAAASRANTQLAQRQVQILVENNDLGRG